ncbi:right-handed parallel beta-helix repeat-containing protein [Oceanirhabdus seepicola]|uniref:Right handed beta helix domain-containing protein n=1 Tax=Oceanirhabdus seepicola TaxID=2828781 RepID=A0A9J6P4B4_9CLOT|nr:right-handed parallel beta-helix repeat-containing protein [Oceanirhabdus seepicola]MCM1990929.1 hypothetical protein [Oceanirhabdus seepicola]
MADIIVPTDKSTIQDAVNSASAGDTIILLPGEYKEQVIITQKDITIRGLTVIGVNIRGINSNDIAFTVLADNIKFYDLNIENYYVGAYINGDSIKMEEVHFSACGSFGMVLSGKNNTITNCSFDECRLFGMNIGGDYHKITNNVFNNNILGCVANSIEPLTNTIICKNIATKSPVGINLSHSGSKYNEIIQNVITTDTGLFVNSPYTKIDKNSFQNCEDAGMIINSQNNEINNNVISNGRNGIIVIDRCNKFERQIIGNMKEACVTFADGDNSFTSGVLSNSTKGIRSIDNSNQCQNNVFVNVEKDSILV